MNETKRPDNQLYAGWIVLAACFTSAMLIIGGSIYIYQLFVLPVTNEFGISRGQASYAFIAMLIGIAFWSPILGKLYDRITVKWLMPAGALAYTMGMVTISQSASLYIMLAAIFLLLGPAMVLAGGLAANTITTRWFEKRRGRALGIAAIASSAGGFLMVPASTLLVEGYGWRTALLTLGVTIGAVIIFIGLFVVRDRPTIIEREQTDEFAERTNNEENLDGPQWTFLKLLASRNFWLVTVGVGLLLASDQAILTSQYPYLVDIGFSAAQAASVVTAMTGSAIAGKLIVGFLAERWDIRWLFVVVAAFHGLLLGIFLLQPSFTIMLLFASIFGAAVGGVYPVWSVLCSQVFGARSFGVSFGAMALFTQILAMIFVAYINNSHDNTGSYQTAFSVFLIAVFLSIFMIVFVRAKEVETAAP
ncbi:MAG: MFS transporter [Parasphingorhabdus sp.]